MKKNFSKIKFCFLILILFITVNCLGQTISISGKIIQADSLNPVFWCRIIVNDSLEYSPNSLGEFSFIITVKKISKIEFAALGYYSLTVKDIPKSDSLKFDTVALSLIEGVDDFFVTISKKGKRNRKADKKRKLQNKTEMIKQSSKAYIVFDKKVYHSENEIIKIR